MKRFVLISLVTDKKLEKENYGRSLLSLFYDRFPELKPEYASFTDPVNNPITTVNDALQYWEDSDWPGFICKRRQTVKSEWYIGTDKNKLAHLDLEYAWNNKINWLSVFKKVQECVNAYFGYLHFFTAPEWAASRAKGLELYCEFRNGAIGWKVEEKGIPDLGWATYFGKKYQEDIPISQIQKEGAIITPQNDGHIIQLTDNIFDIHKDFKLFDEKRDRVKSHFPKGFFQEYTND
jgi:hypothetical protein